MHDSNMVNTPIQKMLTRNVQKIPKKKKLSFEIQQRNYKYTQANIIMYNTDILRLKSKKCRFTKYDV